MTKPLLIFDGNCQAQYLAAVFQGAGLARSVAHGRDFGSVPGFNGQICQYGDEAKITEIAASTKSEGGVVVQVSQRTPWHQSDFSYTATADRHVFFPYLACRAMTVADGHDIERVYAADLEIMELCENLVPEASGITEFVRSTHSKQSLFHTDAHPGALLSSRLFSLVADQLADIICGDSSAVAHSIASTEGMNFQTNHPVSDRFLALLQFSWPLSYQAYTEMLRAATNQAWDILDQRKGEFRTLFAHDTQFHWAYLNRAATAGDFAAMKSHFEELIRTSPGYLEPWFTMFAYGGLDDDILWQAHQVLAGHRMLDHVLCRAYSYTGEHRKAVESGERFHSAAADLDGGFVPLALALAGSGQILMARNLALDSFYAKEPYRRDGVARYITHNSWLGIAESDLDFNAPVSRTASAMIPN